LHIGNSKLKPDFKHLRDSEQNSKQEGDREQLREHFFTNHYGRAAGTVINQDISNEARY
jgi:hypothetical protein